MTTFMFFISAWQLAALGRFCKNITTFMFLFQLGSWQHSVSGDMEDPVVALVSTGWLHVAGPDGSEGATIVGDVDTLGNIDFGPLHYWPGGLLVHRG